MPQTDSVLIKSFQILHSLILSFVIAFLLEPSILSSYVIISPNLVFFQILSVVLVVLLIPAQIYFYSGIYGVFLEIAAGETFLITRKQFHKNAKQFWKIYLSLSILPFFLHFLSFVFLGSQSHTLDFVKIHTSAILTCLIAIAFLQHKYLKPLKLSLRKIKISAGNLFILSILIVLHLSTYYFPFLLDSFPDIDRILLFISKYLNMLTFIFVAHLFLENYPEITVKYQNQKELILINPGGGGILTGLATMVNREYPPVFVVLKALTPPDYKITEFNRVRWHQHYYQSHKLVAITCYTSNSAEAYKLAKEFKRHGSTVIMGGPHVTYMTDEALQFCDSVVVGEAEGIWPQILKDYEANCLKQIYTGQSMEEYHKVVHQYLLKSSPDIIKSFLETTRGCKFRCHFCSIPNLSGGTVRNKPPLEVVELLQKIKHHYSRIAFLDNNIYSDPNYAKELFEALKPLKIKWQSFCTIDIAKNEKLLTLAKESGCDMLAIGYEITGDSPEQEQRGKFAMAERYLSYSQKIKDAGINIRSGFIWGFDSDKYQSLLNIWKFALAIKPAIAVMSLLTPIPGTKLFNDMAKANRLKNINWRHYAALDMIFEHPNLNYRIVSQIFFPYIAALFFLTTSRKGQIFLMSLIALIVFYNFFRML